MKLSSIYLCSCQSNMHLFINNYLWQISQDSAFDSILIDNVHIVIKLPLEHSVCDRGPCTTTFVYLVHKIIPFAHGIRCYI